MRGPAACNVRVAGDSPASPPFMRTEPFAELLAGANELRRSDLGDQSGKSIWRRAKATETREPRRVPLRTTQGGRVYLPAVPTTTPRCNRRLRNQREVMPSFVRFPADATAVSRRTLPPSALSPNRRR